MLKKRKRILLVLSFCAFAITFSFTQNTFDFSVENQSIPETLRQLSEVSEINIAFSERFFLEGKRISFSKKNTSLKAILNEILKDQSVEFRLAGNRVIISKKVIENFTVSGYLTDASSGERLIYANIFTNLGNGTTTNEYGFYSLTLPAGKVKLTMSYIGFSEAEKEFLLDKNLSVNQSLSPSLTLAEVIVMPVDLKNLEPLPSGLSSENITIERLNSIPNIGGESDLVQAIGLLPGVQNGTDGLGGLHVRGGSADQNLMLLDGVPIYHSGHLLNMFSVYNSQTINSARFFKSGFSARYGGRLSSVLDVRTKEGNSQQFSGDAEVGILSAKGTLEGPLKKGKGSFMVSGRGSLWQYMVGRFLAPILSGEEEESDDAEEEKSTEINFYDLNAKLNYDFGRDRLYLSYYIGRDIFKHEIYIDEDERRETDETRGSWGNQIFALRWNRQFSAKTFANTTLTYSNYNFRFQQLFEEFEDETYSFFAQSSDIRDVSLNTDFEYHISPDNKWKFGGGTIFHALTPEDFYIDEETDESDENEDFEVADFQDDLSFAETLFSGEVFAYAENELRLSSKTNLGMGLRVSSFFSDEVATVQPEPRFFINQNIGNLSLTASASRMVQYLHRATTSNLNLPDSKWIPTSEEHPEETSWQETLGLEFSSAKNWIFSTEGYYKNFRNQVLFPFSVLGETADSSYQGSGIGYGIEAMIQKKGRTGGNINYTWAKANRQYEGYNSGQIFPYQFDQRHNVKLHFYHKFNSTLRADLTWTYATANPVVLLVDGEEVDPEDAASQAITLLSKRGEPNHSMNLGLKYSIQKGDFLHQVKVGVYNVYNRKNAHFSRLESGGGLEETSLFGILPALSYRLKFR